MQLHGPDGNGGIEQRGLRPQSRANVTDRLIIAVVREEKIYTAGEVAARAAL